MAKNEKILVVTCVNTRRRKRYIVDSLNDVCPACGEFHSSDNYIMYDTFGNYTFSDRWPKLEKSV